LTTLVDNFDRADSGTLGTASGGFSWTANGMVVSSNQAIGSGGVVEQAQSDLATADHEVQADDIFGSNWGLTARHADASNFYLLQTQSNAVELWKCVASNFTQLANTTGLTISSGDTIKLSVNGTGLTGYQNGVSRATATDSAISGNLRCGMRAGGSNTYDNWQAADIAVAPAVLQSVIGASRIASRGVGPQVQRFMFRQPIGIFGGVVLDPPGQTAGAVVLANPMVGPPVMRQRARRPFLSGPVASGATSVLSPLVVHTYTARVPQVQASVKPAQVTHTYTAQTPQVRASVKPSQATHTYVGQVPQVRAQVRPGQVTHTYTARVPVVSAGTRVQVAQVPHTYTAQVPQVRAQVRPAQATHTYTGRVPNIVSGASIIPPVVTHAYTGRVPQVRAQVRPAQVTHSYTARVPQVQIATRVSAVLVTHSYTSRVPGFKTSIPAPRITHTYTSRVPVVVIAGAPLYGFGARARIGAASARDPWSRIGSASATDANKKIGSDKA
jgi:hypothetical protein